LQETKIKGYVNIVGYRIISDENIDPGRYGFKLVHESDRSYFFSSDQQPVIREWMKALMKATIDRDYTSAYYTPIYFEEHLTNVRRAGGVFCEHSNYSFGGSAGHEPGTTPSFTECSGGNAASHEAREHQPAVHA